MYCGQSGYFLNKPRVYIYIYIYNCVHLLVNITDLLGLLKKCRCNGQLCALDERIEKYFEISVWIEDGLNVLRTLLNGTFFH